MRRAVLAVGLAFLLLAAGCAAGGNSQVERNRVLSRQLLGPEQLYLYRYLEPLLLPEQQYHYLYLPNDRERRMYIRDIGLFDREPDLLYYYGRPFRNEVYIEMHPELSVDTRMAIRESRVINGMTKEQVLAAYGYPHRFDDHTFATSGVWVYPGPQGPRYLFFDFNHQLTLTSWREGRQVGDQPEYMAGFEWDDTPRRVDEGEGGDEDGEEQP